MAEPSVTDILSSADPERGSGTPAVVIDQSNLVRNITQGAQFKAQNDWNKYNLFLNNLKDVYKDLGDISAVEVATADREGLQKDAGDVYKSLLNNPADFFGGGPGMAAIQQKLGALKSKSIESKLNRTYDMAHREYLNRNPELNTPENQEKIQQYLKQPLGSRQSYMLDMPVVFNPSELAKGIIANPTVQQKFAETSLVDENKKPGKQFIRELQGVRYKRQPFMNAWMSALNSQQDKYGHSIRRAVDQQFNQLPDQLKKQFKNTEGYFKALGEAAFNSDKDIESVVKDDLQANPNAYKEQDLAMARERLAQGWANYGLAKEKLNREKDEDVSGAASVANEALSIGLKASLRTPIENYKGKKGVTQVYGIADPTLLQTFGNIDKEGKVTNVPDDVYWDKDKGQLDLIYFKIDPTTGEPEKTASGKRIIKDSKSLDERTWLKSIVKRSFPNKDIGKINNIVEEWYTKGGGNLDKIIQRVKGVQGTEKVYKYGGKDYSESQLQAAANQSGMTLQDYKKQLGL